MVERMVSHGQWITMSDDQVVRRLEEHGDTEAGGTPDGVRGLGCVVCLPRRGPNS